MSGRVNRLLILAGSFEQARRAAGDRMFTYVGRLDTLYGLARGSTLYVVGTAYERRDYADIMMCAITRGLKPVRRLPPPSPPVGNELAEADETAQIP